MKHLNIPEDQIDRAFETFELLLFLIEADAASVERRYGLSEIGRATDDRSTRDPQTRSSRMLLDDLYRLGNEHPWLQAGMFGGTQARLRPAIGEFMEAWGRERTRR
jgi:hypothetical protein